MNPSTYLATMAAPQLDDVENENEPKEQFPSTTDGENSTTNNTTTVLSSSNQVENDNHHNKQDLYNNTKWNWFWPATLFLKQEQGNYQQLS